MIGARTATLGFVLSTTTDRPDASDSEMSCSWRRCRVRLFRSRSLLTRSCVPAKRSRKNVDLPDAGNPIRITHSIHYRDLNMGFDHWVSELEKRHLADLRIAEVTRALRALSSAYVERRHRGTGPLKTRHALDRTLDSAGK